MQEPIKNNHYTNIEENRCIIPIMKNNENNNEKLITICTNYFKFKFLNKDEQYFNKYTVMFIPELPDDIAKLEVLNTAKNKISFFLNNNIYKNNAIYSLKNLSQNKFIVVSTNYKEQNYKIEISWACILDYYSEETFKLFNEFLNELVKELKFTELKGKYYDLLHPLKIEDYQIELFSSYKFSINSRDSEIFLSTDVGYRVIREDTILDKINSIQKYIENDNSKEYIEKIISEKIKGEIVITKFNGINIYEVYEVDFYNSPETLLETMEGENTFFNYYKINYGKLNSVVQPLLISKDIKTGLFKHLIPELCYISESYDNLHDNPELMKIINDYTDSSKPNGKIMNNIHFINRVLNEENCKKIIKKWGINISDKPLLMEGKIINAGNILMSKKGDTDVKVNIPKEKFNIYKFNKHDMYSYIPLEDWAVIFIFIFNLNLDFIHRRI
jgi:hypothetical protein